MGENPIKLTPVGEQPSSEPKKPDDKLPLVPVPVSKVDAKKDTPAAHTNTEKRKRKPLTCFEIWIIVLTGIGILVAAGTGGAIIWQDVIASRTLGELQKQYPELKKSSDAAKHAANTASAALKASIDSFRTDERAWVEIEPIKPLLLTHSESDIGDIFTCNIYLHNLGKTVATNISVRAEGPMSTNGWDENAQVVTGSQDRIPKVIPSSRVQRVLAPNEIAAAPFRLTCPAPQTFKSGGQLIHYLIGRIDYVDQFRIAHWKRFCYFVVNNRGEIWNCQQGNQEDNNPETPPN
jgi:hypothetical protein